MKLTVSIISCPRCGRVLPARDWEDTKLHEAKCQDCGLEIEAVFDEYGNLKEIKPKSVN